MKMLQKADKIFDKIVDYMLLAAAIIIIFDAIAVSQDVIIRYFLDFTWAPLYEIMAYSLVWITFLGTTAIMRIQGHVKMDSITGRLPLKIQDIVNLITSCLCTLLLAGIIFYTVKLLIYDYQTGFTLASILNPPKWPIEIIISIGFIMLFIQVIRNGYGFFKTYKDISRKTVTEKEIVSEEKKAYF
jgi:TRAP-type C4-dicarboxylate transport system permease small subunit